jgi:hypothetical protein
VLVVLFRLSRNLRLKLVDLLSLLSDDVVLLIDLTKFGQGQLISQMIYCLLLLSNNIIQSLTIAL